MNALKPFDFSVLKSNIRIATILVWLVSLMAFSGCREDEETPVPAIETGTMTDIDGNVYRTVKIGGQWWMAENLKVSSYRNGNAISLVGNNPQDWQVAQSAYCVYDNATEPPGFLYNWAAVNHPDGLAPDGWRIPTDEDWKTLERHLGMSSSIVEQTGWRGSGVGEKMKIAGLESWVEYGDVWGTNESGFSAEAGSCRMFTGVFGSPGLKYNGFWWSSTDNGNDEAWYRHLDYKEKRVFRYYGIKKYGFSVRCIKE